jgi:TonB-dependent SusC/RagA subfamily outer membrane receptor
MFKSSPQLPGRTRLALLTGLLPASVFACARPTTTAQAEPQVVPPEVTIAAADSASGEIQKRAREPIASLLQGRASGVDVSVLPNGTITVHIQGVESFYAGTEPLIVVDGIPVASGPGGALAGINPEDIESIRVLKYPPETSLYGVRGANGVIVITTKRPKP